MSTRKRKASSSEEPVCVLCGRADVDPNICGHTLDEKGIRVHQYCLEFAITFTEASLIRLATEGLPLGAIRRAAKHATKQQCFVCGERGAAITCSETGCERSFHLPCAMDGECVTQHFRQRRCYCWEHRPRQEIQEAPEEGTICLICLEPVGDSLSYHTMACPTCQHAWFHRGCIQQQALNAGAFCFYCPGCRDKDQFFQEMATMGIQIPHRLVSFCSVLLTLRLSCWACPGTVSAGLALGCLVNMCPSFMEKLEVELGWMCWDNLASYAGHTGGSSLALSSLAEDQIG
ncbi:PHD finger protein 7-like isoform X1 [Gallus gallus]|uniref:PHD finger protein 7-like isoform X1 n=1 Tax=Gallus gallus TaxID=9031 RepID=UPI001AE747B3|nr:PHD finger protein 7-like isoform X1 [Gallus gallus]